MMCALYSFISHPPFASPVALPFPSEQKTRAGRAAEKEAEAATAAKAKAKDENAAKIKVMEVSEQKNASGSK